MRKSLTLVMIALGVALTAPVSAPVTAQGQSISFFVSSTGSGMGGNLGGLTGADKHCQTLAAKAGAGNRTWRAYLSTSMPDANARDRIGSGPGTTPRGHRSRRTSTICTRTRPTSITTLRSTSRAVKSIRRARQTGTTSSLDQQSTARPPRRPARTGRAVPATRTRWWDTTIASRSANLDRPGIRPTRPKDARRRIWSRPAEPG